MLAIWLCFYDDFPTLAPSVLADSSKRAVQLLLKLLGWQYSDNADKDVDFAESFAALGVVFHLSRLDEGLASVANKENRVLAVVSQLAGLALDRRMSKVQAESMRGKLQFMGCQIFGRAGKAAMWVFAGRAEHERSLSLRD